MKKTSWVKRGLAVIISAAMLVNMVVVSAFAEESAEGGQYVSEVFIAYGKTEKEAAKWLTDNGWEPVKGDFNAGKASFFDDNKLAEDNVAAVMGIKRTDKKDNAITDMAVMNMKGGYSIPDYEKLIEQKKTQINEIINGFMPVIEEYRANYNNEGSEYGAKRAKVAYDLLNKFYEGDPEDPVAKNDTGLALGDWFLSETKQEGNKEGGDLEQLMLESSGPAMIAVESMLTMAADTGEETWLERASGLTGDELSENLAKYAPEAEGLDVAPSAVAQYLGQKYGDTAMDLQGQWATVNDDIRAYEAYMEENGLWQEDNESDEDYANRVSKFFDDLKAADEEAYNKEHSSYTKMTILYNRIYEIPFEGDWGETLGDFLNPADDSSFADDPDNFLPLAAALSDGQRAGLDYLSFETLLILGLGTEEGIDSVAPDLSDIFGDETEIDVYTGVNREAFRGGVAITSEALMEQNAGKGQAFDKIWDNTGIAAITSYSAAIVGAVTLGAGTYMAVKGVEVVGRASQEEIDHLQLIYSACKNDYEAALAEQSMGNIKSVPGWLKSNMDKAKAELDAAQGTKVPTKMGVAGRWMMGIGGALMIGAAIVKGVQLWKYYDRTMKPIPRMIVDESDIVTYLTDEKTGKPILDDNGNQKKNINFNTYEYYTAVKCNRPDVGEVGDWQDGVKEYKDHNCYDIADLNADMGQEWIALYTVKSENKGNPILADSLTMQYGKKSMPDGCEKAMHLFTYTNAVDLGDTAWAFNNKKGGVYFFWDEDEKAFAADTASAFSGGHLALAGIGGLILGLAGATLVLKPRRKKEEAA